MKTKTKKYPKIEAAVRVVERTLVPIAFAIIDSLATLGEVAFLDPYENIHQTKWRQTLRANHFTRRAYHTSITRCVNRGWVKKTKKDGKLFLKLTAQGQLQLLQQRLKYGFHKRQPHDGSFWLILFDIPEMASRDRDALRRFLRSIKFSQLQKSVYISPYPIPQEAFVYLEQTNLRRFIRCMRVSEVDNPKDFKHLLKNAAD